MAGSEKRLLSKSLLNGYPLGLIYFNIPTPGKFEILDGQQRVTSIGRFVTGKFAVLDDDKNPQYFESLSTTQRERILASKLLIYECEGEPEDIRKWFEVINIAGVPLNSQELWNAVYSGPFVSKAKEFFSNSRNAHVNKWSAYLNGSANRQDFLKCALDWVSKGNIKEYMSAHRSESSIDELRNHFNSVLDWVSTVFESVDKEMKGLEWGRLYETYHKGSYDPEQVEAARARLYEDPFVSNKRGIYEYILGGQKDTRLLEVRLFDKAVISTAYAKQTKKAQEKGVSNCPLCAVVQARTANVSTHRQK